MSFTVKQVRAKFPEVQFCGGEGILHIGHHNVLFGRVGEGGAFFPSDKGREMLESAYASASTVASAGAKAKGKKPAQERPPDDFDLGELE